MKEVSQEKRGYVRLPVSFTVKYAIEGDTSGPSKETISKDISEGGILFPVKELLLLSAKLNLIITIPKLSNPILTEGRVVRIDEITEGKLYDVGVVFTKIEEKDAQFIREYIRRLDLNKILNFAIKNKTSDIHLVANQPPIMRIFGKLTPMQMKPLSSDEVKGLIYGLLNQQQIERFEAELELDMSYTTDFGRFRVNIHKEKGQFGAAFRYIPTEINTIEELGLPPIIKELARKPHGLVLVTGPTGSGKSTTLAAMIELINKEKQVMIISLEDPIEYIHMPKKSIIRQREIGFDSLTFINALKHTLRQDVDVILIGEMRDLESISIALTAAETGHLVLSTLHTADAISSINRIIDIFPGYQQQQIKIQLAECLQGIIAQALIPKESEPGRVVATEVLLGTPAIANLIRQGHLEQIYTNIEVGAKLGMHLMDSSLLHLYKEGIISREDALNHAKDPAKFI
jgi:twitching motility protein PilT